MVWSALAWDLQLRQPVVIIHKQHNLRQDTTQFICSRHGGNKTENPRTAEYGFWTVQPEFGVVFLPPIVCVCVCWFVCVCAFAVKFEKWKLMINDIADQWRAASRAANTKLSTFVWRHSATEINETTETKQFPPLPIPWGTHVWATKLINVKSFFDY